MKTQDNPTFEGFFKQHPDQRIQEEWMEWLGEGEWSYSRYVEFLEWRDEWLKLNPLD